LSRERLLEHRLLWKAKPVLERVYEPWFQALLADVPQGGRVLEVGAGPGLLSEWARRRRPDAAWIASDLHAVPWNDLAADAGSLPLRTGGVSAVLGLDVLHHLPRPALFFREAARVLAGDGRLVLVEPWITPLSWVVYRFFHQEDCRLHVDPWNPFPGLNKDSFDGDAAVPWRLVRDTLHAQWRDLGLEPPRVRRLNAFAYLLSLGFRPSSLLPLALVTPALALDRATEALAPLTGLRALISWERRESI
jgi:SAM-dependent methyltransferase